ncbi:molecular chaperone [Streptomyces sp. NPDC004111]|uniref:TorD/DmsD family molecular chaperone n=1 Tax=Streptomyces sp. NPDC004111 TaxID=3364690 RepID=UPI0036B21702
MLHTDPGATGRTDNRGSGHPAHTDHCGSGHPDTGPAATTPAAPDPGTALYGLAAACTVLSRLLLTAPDQQVLDRLRDPGLLADWPLPPCEATDRGLVCLARSADENEDATAVTRDYNRLFVGPERLLAPPYESVHRSEDQLVFEAETFQVRAFYARFGLTAPRLGREPDDHIGLELDLVATLCIRAAEALDRTGTTRTVDFVAALREFLTGHLLAWAPDFMEMVEAHARTRFYQGVGTLGSGVLAHAAQWCGLARPEERGDGGQGDSTPVPPTSVISGAMGGRGFDRAAERPGSGGQFVSPGRTHDQ